MPGLWQANGSHADCARQPGYRELRTYGCVECGVWVTEGRAPSDERDDSFIPRVKLCLSIQPKKVEVRWYVEM